MLMNSVPHGNATPSHSIDTTVHQWRATPPSALPIATVTYGPITSAKLAASAAMPENTAVPSVSLRTIDDCSSRGCCSEDIQSFPAIAMMRARRSSNPLYRRNTWRVVAGLQYVE